MARWTKRRAVRRDKDDSDTVNKRRFISRSHFPEWTRVYQLQLGDARSTVSGRHVLPPRPQRFVYPSSETTCTMTGVSFLVSRKRYCGKRDAKKEGEITFDHQALLALHGRQHIRPIPLTRSAEARVHPARGIRIGFVAGQDGRSSFLAGVVLNRDDLGREGYDSARFYHEGCSRRV